MPRLRRLLVRSRVETAIRSRKCKFNRNHRISKGDRCLVFLKGRAKINYCYECAKRAFAETTRDLSKLHDDLEEAGLNCNEEQ